MFVLYSRVRSLIYNTSSLAKYVYILQLVLHFINEFQTQSRNKFIIENRYKYARLCTQANYLVE